MLDDDQPFEPHDTAAAAAGGDEKSTFEAADPATPSSPSLTLLGVSPDPGTDDEKNTPDILAKHNTYDRAGDGQGAGTKSHEREALYTRTARGNGSNECSGSDLDSDPPASVGQIHDIFAEYEETFGMPKSKQKAARATAHNCPDTDTAARSIPRGAIQGEPRVTADDGLEDVEQAAEGAGDDNAARLSKRDLSLQELAKHENALNGPREKVEETYERMEQTLERVKYETVEALRTLV
jgi:hypothetical protein